MPAQSTHPAPVADPVPCIALFVPATRPERIARALASGAQHVIVDLEDAVAPAQRPAARAALIQHAQAHPEQRWVLRVNAADTPDFADDLPLARLPQVSAVLLAKAHRAADIEALHEASGRPVWALIESAAGVAAWPEMVQARGLARGVLGTLDLALDLRLNLNLRAGPLHSPYADSVLDQARFALVLHSRCAGLPAPLDGVFPDLKDDAGLLHMAQRAAGMGLAGMLAIHPLQVATIASAWARPAGDTAWARRVLAAAQASAGGVVQLDGEMIDAPVIARARQILQGHPAADQALPAPPGLTLSPAQEPPKPAILPTA